jgi:hypothetical protein
VAGFSGDSIGWNGCRTTYYDHANLNILSTAALNFEIGGSKQCLADHELKHSSDNC